MEALFWAKRGLELVEVDRYYVGSGRTVVREIEKRIGRLYKRIYRSPLSE